VGGIVPQATGLLQGPRRAPFRRTRSGR